jgi:hypothetical protein
LTGSRNGLTIVAAVREEGLSYQAFRQRVRKNPDWQVQVDWKGYLQADKRKGAGGVGLKCQE